MPHLNKHETYVMHYKQIKFLHELGVKVTEHHRTISFFQKDWLQGTHRLEHRQADKGKARILKRFFKLMHNSVFGKTMGNVNGRMELKLTTDCEKTIKRFSKLHVKVSLFLFLRRATHDRHVLKNGNRIQARICRHDRIRPW